MSNNELSLSLSIFNGPLDLLLHLVKEEKIEIKDIFVSEVTSQFLLYMSQLDTIDVNKASEYMEMAATLLEIKSRALLPKMPGFDEVGDSPEKLLIRQLEEYKMFKEASETLKVKEDVNRLYKEPDKMAGKVSFTVKDISLESLLDAFTNIMHKMELTRINQATPRQIKKDTFSVSDKIIYIREQLSFCDAVKFSELFDPTSTRNEIAVTFIAMLELMKTQAIRAEQTKELDEIIITKNVNYDEDYEYDEESN